MEYLKKELSKILIMSLIITLIVPAVFVEKVSAKERRTIQSSQVMKIGNYEIFNWTMPEGHTDLMELRVYVAENEHANIYTSLIGEDDNQIGYTSGRYYYSEETSEPYEESIFIRNDPGRELKFQISMSELEDGLTGETTVYFEAKKASWDYKIEGDTFTYTGSGKVGEGISDLIISENSLKKASPSIDISTIKKVVVEDNITAICDDPLYGLSSLTTLVVGEKLKATGLLIAGVYNLKSIIVSENNQNLKVVNNVLYSKDGKTLIGYPCGLEAKEYVVPDSVETIDEYAFYCNSTIEKITLGSGVKSLGKADYALHAMNGIKDIEVSENNSKYLSKGGLLYSKDGTILYRYPTKLRDENTDEITGTVYNGTVEIAYEAFAKCFDMQAVVLPSTLKKIDKAALGLTSVSDVYFRGSEEQWKNIEIEYCNDNIENADVVYDYTDCTHKMTELLKAKVATATEDGYTGDTYCMYCGKLITQGKAIPKTGTAEEAKKDDSSSQNQNTLVENQVVDLGSSGSYTVKTDKDGNVSLAYAPAANSKSKSIKVPSSVEINGVKYPVTEIADNAFKNNKKVTKITIPASVTEIGANAFKGCKNLKTLKISSGVTNIGKNAFSGCKKLKTITVDSKTLTKKSIANAFKGSNVTTVKVPAKMVKKYKKIFTKANCGKKVKIVKK